ncbi:phage recombination protein Bet [uncultured Dubosiella sp.]|uniref:phage recombination protein Bet n=1 Tax=uncultured Dubosiella sp. TaxID=1937011 RepID=UPI002631DF71|nr:phage recombination protein Bet [uncultured Dubosiella sp.]
MQVQNNLRRNSKSQIISYKVGNDDVKLSSDIVRQYLVNGNGEVTDQEVTYFIHLCRGMGLNPFLKEAYLIKYGSSPATTVVSKEAFLKRAERSESFDGFEAGIIILNQNGELEYRKGSFYMKNREELVGGWCEVYKKNCSHPYRSDVSLDEYIGRKSDGSVNSMWSTKMATMIRKVAMSQALREAFPDALNQLFTEEEMNVDVQLDSTPIEQPDVQAISQSEPQVIPQSIPQQTQIPQEPYYQERQTAPQFVQQQPQQEVMMERPSFV